MNRNRADSYIPALAATRLDLPPAWGRLTSLSPQEAEFLSQFELPAGRELALDFDLGGAGFSAVTAVIKTRLRDKDGYFHYRLVFSDTAQRELLRQALAALPRR